MLLGMIFCILFPKGCRGKVIAGGSGGGGSQSGCSWKQDGIVFVYKHGFLLQKGFGTAA